MSKNAFRGDASAWAAVGIAFLILKLAVVAAWLTHVVICLKAGTWGFLLVGAIVFPIAIVHGFGHWLGIF